MPWFKNVGTMGEKWRVTMSSAVNPDLLLNLKKFGVNDAAACFNCGNCTAVCSLSSESEPFPRKTTQHLQLGLDNKLMQSPEPLLCYYCGDCSVTCKEITKG